MTLLRRWGTAVLRNPALHARVWVEMLPAAKSKMCTEIDKKWTENSR